MRRARTIATLLVLGGLARGRDSEAQVPRIESRAESSGYDETSRYADVVRFVDEIRRVDPSVRVETFGRSAEGRDLPLLFLADPPATTPVQARRSGKPVVFVMANIHAGEVEGKEAALHLARRVAVGDLRPLLARMTILIAPIYNADGNEAISPRNRPEQNGPVAGVGSRENAGGLDLNRDFMKLESPEARALVRLMGRWDPHLTIDLHTTNGSDHGYHLTYSIPLNPAVDPRIAAFERDRMMPAIGRAMLDRHRLRTYYYGNFAETNPNTRRPEPRSWQAFTHLPRIGQNYVGLRNRLAILSEAYSYLDFRGRIAATEAFVEEILRYVADRGPEVVRLTEEADDDATRRGQSASPGNLGVEFAMTPLPSPVEILVGEVRQVANPRSGLVMSVMVEDRVTPVRMLDYGQFAATRSVARPFAYLVRPDEDLRPIRDLLMRHGIVIEELTGPLRAEVEVFDVTEVRRSPRPSQGHREVRLSGQSRRETAEFPARTILVRSSQPLATLASYLLEPESDDGLVTWNVLDARLAPGRPVPVSKLIGVVNVPTRIIPPDR